MGRLPARFRTSFANALSVAFLVLVPVGGSAFEAVLTLPESASDLRKPLEGSSLVFTAQNNDVENPQDIVSSARAEYRRLLSVLYSQGYFGPEISVLVDGREAATLPPFETITSVRRVELRVNPGKQFVFGRADIAPVAPDTTITETFRTGQPAQTGPIVQAARQGVEGWREDGHAKATVVKEDIIADHRDTRLDVNIAIEPGPKLRFGALHLSGKTRISEERLREIIALPTGETFSPEELDRIGRRLRRTGVFRSVSISEAENIGAGQTLDIEINVEDEKLRRLSLGAEIESNDGLSLTATWTHRNLFGGGERLVVDGEIGSLGAQVGGTDYLLSAELTRPATFRPDTDILGLVEIERKDDPLYLIEKAGALFAFRRIFSEKLAVSGGLLFEATNSTDDFGYREFRNLGVPLRVIWDQRDDKLDATEGYFVSGTVMPYASFNDGAPGTYVFADTRAYRRLGSDRIVAAGRLQLGSILGPDLADVPPDLLFLSGGGGTVRGQPYQSNFVSVGGIDSGGLSFIDISGELRVKTTESLSAVAFYDAGFVGETSNFSGPGNWQAGAGLGVRYHTSFGPIRVDLGLPVSGGTSGGAQIYVGIGQAF